MNPTKPTRRERSSDRVDTADTAVAQVSGRDARGRRRPVLDSGAIPTGPPGPYHHGCRTGGIHTPASGSTHIGAIHLGMNLEAIRRHEKPFEWGVEKAAELGFEYIEPMVHWGRELMSEAHYYHTVSMWDDPYRIRRAAEKAGLKVSGPAGPRPGLPARRARRLPEAGDPLRRRVRRPGGQHRRRHQGPLDHRRGRPRADALHAARGRPGGRAAGDQDRPGMPRPVLENARRARPHLQPGRSRRRSASTSTPATPTWPARTRTPGWNASSTGWSTCTPRTSPSSTPTPSGAR